MRSILLISLLLLLFWLGYEVVHAYHTRQTIYRYSQPRHVIEDISRSPKVLLIGNSLTFFNDLPQMTERLASQISPAWRDAVITSIAPSGYHLGQHLEDLEGSILPRDIRHALGDDSEINWHTVVLQDGSQVMDTPTTHPIHQRAMHAIPRLGERIVARGASPMLFITWGYSPEHTEWLSEDESSAMSARIESGYREAGAMLDAWLNKGSPEGLTRYLPAGEAFLNMRSRHPDLYPRLFVDDRHPSAAGTYLVAALLARSLTGARIEPASWHPPELSAQGALTLRQLADELSDSHEKR